MKITSIVNEKPIAYAIMENGDHWHRAHDVAWEFFTSVAPTSVALHKFWKAEPDLRLSAAVNFSITNGPKGIYIPDTTALMLIEFMSDNKEAIFREADDYRRASKVRTDPDFMKREKEKLMIAVSHALPSPAPVVPIDFFATDRADIFSLYIRGKHLNVARHEGKVLFLAGGLINLIRPEISYFHSYINPLPHKKLTVSGRNRLFIGLDQWDTLANNCYPSRVRTALSFARIEEIKAIYRELLEIERQVPDSFVKGAMPAAVLEMTQPELPGVVVEQAVDESAKTARLEAFIRQIHAPVLIELATLREEVRQNAFEAAKARGELADMINMRARTTETLVEGVIRKLVDIGHGTHMLLGRARHAQEAAERPGVMRRIFGRAA